MLRLINGACRSLLSFSFFSFVVSSTESQREREESREKENEERETRECVKIVVVAVDHVITHIIWGQCLDRRIPSFETDHWGKKDGLSRRHKITSPTDGRTDGWGEG